MSDNSTNVVLLLSAAALLGASAGITSAAGGMGGPADLREMGWEFSTAFRRAVGPDTTTVAVYHGARRGFKNDEYAVSTSAGDFDLTPAFTRLAFDPGKVVAGLHEGCTYRFTHHGPRTQFSPDPARWGYSVVYPNITAARHVASPACRTNPPRR